MKRKMVRRVTTTAVWDFSSGPSIVLIEKSNLRLVKVTAVVKSESPIGKMEMTFTNPFGSEVIAKCLATLGNESSGFASSYPFRPGEQRSKGGVQVAILEFKKGRRQDLIFSAAGFVGEVIRALLQNLSIPKLPIPKVTQETHVFVGRRLVEFGEFLALSYSWYWPVHE